MLPRVPPPGRFPQCYGSEERRILAEMQRFTPEVLVDDACRCGHGWHASPRHPEEALVLERIGIKANSIFSKGGVYKPGSEADKAWDGNRDTFYDSASDSGYTAAELAKPSVIAQI